MLLFFINLVLSKDYKKHNGKCCKQKIDAQTFKLISILLSSQPNCYSYFILLIYMLKTSY